MFRAPGRKGLMRRASMPAAAAVAAVLLVGGCGSGSGTGGDGDGGADGAAKGGSPTTSAQAPSAVGAVIDLKGTEYSFTPTALKASAGPTTIRFTNAGAVEHDFTIEALGVHLVAQPGKTAQATVTLKPGTYTSSCSVAGHTESGMHGKLTVS